MKALTVGELRRAIAHVPDDAAIQLEVEDHGVVCSGGSLRVIRNEGTISGPVVTLRADVEWDITATGTR